MTARRRRHSRRLLPAVRALLLALPLLAGSAGADDRDLPPWLAVASYDEPFAPGADHDPGIPAPEEILGAPAGTRPASGGEILACFERIAGASDRVLLERVGSSHEGNPLFYAIVSSPENLARRDEIARVSRLLAGVDGSGPGRIPPDGEQPAVVWVGAAVHGGEPSGADAAVALLHHLAADRREETARLLDAVVVLIDPLLNPDGRARHLADQIAWAGRIPSVDPQSIAHRSPWPSARGNHYLLDLNRDWLAQTQPETRAQAGILLLWRPQVTLDLHEMGSFDTYLFSPPREPYPSRLPAAIPTWWDRFSRAKAEAFGARGWSAYRGDWNEEFNPNRGGSWPLHTGAVAILLEQAGTDGSAIALPGGRVVRYREAVHRHFVAVRAVLETAASARRELLEDYVRNRRELLSAPRGEVRAYVVDRRPRPGAADRLARILRAQGVTVERTREPLRIPEARSYWGERRGAEPFEAGSYLVRCDRGEAGLARALLEFDPSLGSDFLSKERRIRETGGNSLLYESSGWSIAMAVGADVYEVRSALDAAGEKIEADPRSRGTVERPAGAYGFLLDAGQEEAPAAVAALLQRGIAVWATSEGLRVAGRAFGPGSALIRREDNGAGLEAALLETAERTGVDLVGVETPLSDEGPDLGGRTFRPLRPPRVALLTGGSFYSTAAGAVWHRLDRELSIPVSILRSGTIVEGDLDRYNVLILPDAPPGGGLAIVGALEGVGLPALADWVGRGGTLIALGESSWTLFGGTEPMSGIRAYRQVLAELPRYAAETVRETGLAGLRVDEEKLRSGSAGAIARPIDLPPPGAPETPADPAQDEWNRRFGPWGTILRADLDPAHWLAAGAGRRVPVIVRTDLALMARRPIETVGRFAAAADLRLSGLLWPEGRERWASTAYLCRERIGRGQVIAFLGNPIYRAYFHGSGRLLDNAVVLGPGMGTAAVSGY